MRDKRIGVSALCACGCGGLTSGKINPFTHQAARYISGHNARGRVCSEEARRKLSAAARGRTVSASARDAVTGAGNGHWKGDNASYSAFHIWRSTHRPKSGICASCGNLGVTDWDNISGEYRSRDDETDWQELCKSCHLKKTWTTGQRAALRCRGCGCHRDDRTKGCRTCNGRHSKRRSL